MSTTEDFCLYSFSRVDGLSETNSYSDDFCLYFAMKVYGASQESVGPWLSLSSRRILQGTFLLLSLYMYLYSITDCQSESISGHTTIFLPTHMVTQSHGAIAERPLANAELRTFKVGGPQ
jgi:hypothetical protein